MPEHKDITDPNIHEPKGVAAAAAKTAYIATGSGSGTWAKPEAAHVTVLDTASKFTATNVETALLELYQGKYVFEGRLDDVSTASTVLIPIPFDCTVTSVVFILAGSLTTGNSTVTVTRSDGAAMGTQTITQSGSTEGTTFTFTPSGNATFTYSSHKYIKFVTDGASDTARALYIQVHVTRS